MTDQTKWGIDMVQQKNKQKVYAEQKEMRDDIAFFVLNCSVFKLQKMYEEMRRLKNENSNS
jgi:isochorismate hydrolase